MLHYNKSFKLLIVFLKNKNNSRNVLLHFSKLYIMLPGCIHVPLMFMLNAMPLCNMRLTFSFERDELVFFLFPTLFATINNLSMMSQGKLLLSKCVLLY